MTSSEMARVTRRANSAKRNAVTSRRLSLGCYSRDIHPLIMATAMAARYQQRHHQRRSKHGGKQHQSVSVTSVAAYGGSK